MDKTKYIYFNIQLGIFVFTNDKKSNKKYILLPPNELLALAKRNISSIKHYINNESLNTSFLYFSVEKVDHLSIPETQETIKNLYTKPPGMWVSHGTSWLEHIDSYDYANRHNLIAYTYKIELFNTVKVITDKEDFFAFIKKYKKKVDDIRIYDVIDWNKVKEDFTGLIITPHLGNKIWRDNYESFCICGLESAQDFFTDLLGSKWKNNNLLLSEWYRGWPRSAGGYLFSLEAIASFKLVKKTNYTKYLN